MKRAGLLFLFLIMVAASLHAQQATTWWKETVFYQIYMPSFADSNGDGYGDFKGITQKLDYLQSLGIKGIWLTPFLKSPKVDNGYDVQDYYAIDPVYGSMEDFKTFLKEARKRGIKTVMDMVLNHTSTQAEWFREARKSKDNPYRDYYIWKDRPNNWESFLGGPAWEKDSLTHQYYYHKFDVSMADLNWSNPKVADEIKKVLHFWLDLGIDGFRLDVINFLTTDGIVADNPVKDGVQQHIYDIDQPGLKEKLRFIKAAIHEFPDRFVIGEIGSDKIEVLKQYQSPELLDVVFNFNLGSIPSFSTQRIIDELKSMESNMSSYPTLFFGSHDMPRMIDRLAQGNSKKALALAALTITAKGIPFVYYGEEIGMRNIQANTITEMRDVQGITHYRLALAQGKDSSAALAIANDHCRDKSRSPMQWSDSAFAGFSADTSWIKIHEAYKNINVAASLRQPASLLQQYRQLIALRNQEAVLQYGSYTQLFAKDDTIYFTRSLAGTSISVVINLGGTKTINIPTKATILWGGKILEQNEFLIYKID